MRSRISSKGVLKKDQRTFWGKGSRVKRGLGKVREETLREKEKRNMTKRKMLCRKGREH